MIDTPLSALRTYQALARCKSFTATARDQGLAQSAVSRHIASLEMQLGQTLVIRGHRQIQFTEAGKLYLETVHRVLDELDRGAARLGRGIERPVVKILAMPSFAARWLVPRLARLQDAHIEVDIELATSIWDSDFLKERYDIAIHYSDGAWPGASLLMHDSLVPVISPRLQEAFSIHSIDDLAQFRWLHDSLRGSKWPQWLAAVNAEGLSGRRHIKLQDTEATLNAAVAGLGVAIGHAVLIENDVREGRLMQAWPGHVPLAAGYHLIRSKRAVRNPAALRVSAWLTNQAQESEMRRSA
ncbi:LysR substrate-binding domain-containing protein [Variovorax sp. 2RAF20]